MLAVGKEKKLAQRRKRKPENKSRAIKRKESREQDIAARK
jgi:hypothetical protein